MGIITQQLPLTETMTPSPNGVITRFYSAHPIRDNTVSIWLNGLLINANLDTGYTLYLNLGINMKEAPKTGDSLQIKYDLV